jgi:predicted acetyltransferase
VVDIRVMTDDDMPALRRLDDLAFGVTSSESRWEAASSALERRRQLGAFDGPELAGHAGVFTLDLTVPGGQVPAAGVTWVMVSPVHRRRGVLAALMDRQLNHLRDQGEAVAVLWASEPAIYPRFGYGLASRRLSLRVPRAHAALRPTRGSGPGRRLRVGDVAELRPACVQVYEALRSRRPGMVSRSEGAWRETAQDDPSDRGGGSAVRCVLAEAPDGAPLGYAWYRTSPTWNSGQPGGPVDVREVLTDDVATTRAVMSFLLDIDLTSQTNLWNLPLDHPLPAMLADPRRATPTLLDSLWVRLVRLDEAVQARCLSTEVDVVVEVADERCPWNAGRWRLAGGPAGAAVSRSSDPPDLSLDVDVLAAAYLGDPTLGPAHAAGLVEEHTAGALVALDRAMRGDRSPWCSYIF